MSVCIRPQSAFEWILLYRDTRCLKIGCVMGWTLVKIYSNILHILVVLVYLALINSPLQTVSRFFLINICRIIGLEIFLA